MSSNHRFEAGSHGKTSCPMPMSSARIERREHRRISIAGLRQAATRDGKLGLDARMVDKEHFMGPGSRFLELFRVSFWARTSTQGETGPRNFFERREESPGTKWVHGKEFQRALRGRRRRPAGPWNVVGISRGGLFNRIFVLRIAGFQAAFDDLRGFKGPPPFRFGPENHAAGSCAAAWEIPAEEEKRTTGLGGGAPCCGVGLS